MQKHFIHIGTSGWSYKHCKGTFYPEGTKIKDQFPYYISHFNTVELNNSFYMLPKKETFLHWKNIIPDDFRYVVKASRYITHVKKLQDPMESIARFFEHTLLLGKKLGAILFQLPPNLKANPYVLEAFLQQLLKSHRYVFEFRNPDWYQKIIYGLLRQYNCAFCIYELAGHLSPREVTADFVYLCLHGPGDKYQGSYSDETLRQWARQCKTWIKTKDVYVFFDNDQEGYTAFNASKLSHLVQN